MAMGKAATPTEEHPLDSEAVLLPNRESKLVLLWYSKIQGRTIRPESAVPGCLNTNSQVHKDQRGMQPLRSRMATIPIGTTGKEDRIVPAEQTTTIEALEGTGRHLPDLQPANHERNRLA
jgi:hypothetical protein